jgi:hypothetical protein
MDYIARIVLNQRVSGILLYKCTTMFTDIPEHVYDSLIVTVVNDVCV